MKPNVQMIFNTVAIGSDHAGFQLKQYLVNHIKKNLHLNVIDVGAYDEQASNYPEFAHQVAQRMKDNFYAMGILICGTGIGMCVTVNRHAYIRGVLGNFSLENVMLARQHNDANVLCFGGRTDTIDFATKALQIFLTTKFEGGRHQDRINLINNKL